MAAVHLDYLAGRYPNWAGMTVLAIGAVALISVLWHYRDLSGEIADQEILISKLQERGRSPSMTPDAGMRDMEQVARETKQANAAILALSLPWKEFFEAFETTRTKDVAVLAIDPDAIKRVVHIAAEAKDFASMLNYVSSLQKLPLFSEVVITSHQIQDQDPQKPVRFLLQAAWEIRH